MKNTISASLESLQNAFHGTKVARRNADLSLKCNEVLGRVHNFLTSNGLLAAAEGTGQPNSGISVEDLASSVDSVAINELLEQCDIPEVMRGAAETQLALVMEKYFNGNSGSNEVFQYHQQAADGEGISFESLGNVFSSNLTSQLAATEGFGQFVDTTVPDLQNAITIAIMRFHMGLTPRLLPIRPTSEPAVIYNVPRIYAFDLSDTSAAPTPLVDLFDDPGLIANDLPTVTPLDANDTDDLYLVADNVIRFNAEAPLLLLAIDDSTPGYTQTNHTDTIADGGNVDAIKVSLTLDADPNVTSIFRIPVSSMDKARFSRMTNSHDSADRIVSFTFNKFLNSASLVDGSESGSDIFTTADDVDEGLQVTLNFSATMNLKSGLVKGLGSVSVRRWHTSGDVTDVSGAWSTALGASDANITASLVGYELDVRHSEENLRKTTIAVREDKGTLAYELPMGRHYVYDAPLSGKKESNAPIALARITNLGEDYSAIVAIINWLDRISDRVSETDESIDNGDIGKSYAAGSMVRPYVYTGTITISDLNTRQDADRTGDIQQRVKSHLTAITSRIQAASFYQEQIAAGATVTYRLATTATVLGCVLGQPHIHSALDNGVRNTGDGVEYRMTLDNGVILEIVTDNKAVLEDKMVLIPHIAEQPESVLNGGAIWDMGTVVGQFNKSNSGAGAHRRSFSHARQQALPQCPIGAVIDVVGAYAALENDMSA